MSTLYPVGYGRALVTLDELRRRHGPRMHPEYARRLFAWIAAQEGRIGIGGGWRATGTQPDRPGFAPEGRSFHQSQAFPSGSFYCAVDLVARNGADVHRSPTWDEVPAQGSPAAARWGVHCNVAGEPWHMQPIEIDGWLRWVGAGRPDLEYGRPLPTDPPPPTGDPDMFQPIALIRLAGTRAVYAQWPGFKTWVPDPDTLAALRVVYPKVGAIVDVSAPILKAAGPIVGPPPPDVDGFGVPTTTKEIPA